MSIQPTKTASQTAVSQTAGLGLPTLVALVIANMIGAGIFTSSGYSLMALGNPGRVMLAWALCGVWAICGAIAYGSLASRLPMSGGEYIFLSRFVHPAVGFLAGWISVIAGFTAPIALAAMGAAVYAAPNLAPASPWLSVLAAVIVLVAMLCHLANISLGAGAQNAIVVAKLSLLAILIVWMFGFTPAERWQGGPLPDRPSGWLPADFAAWSVLAGSMSWVALSYTGFNAAVYIAAEARDPKRSVPQAMLLATLIVTVIYLLLNLVFVYAPPPGDIAGKESVAAIAALAVGGESMELLVRVIIVLSMISSVFAMLLAGPRVYQKMAEDGVMPRIFRGITANEVDATVDSQSQVVEDSSHQARSNSPRAAVIAQAMLSLVAVFAADLLQLMRYLGLTLSACGALAVMSLWWVRQRLPFAAPLRWWETTAMVGYLSITACILAASWTEHPQEFNAMLITFAVGLAVYIGSRVWDAKKR